MIRMIDFWIAYLQHTLCTETCETLKTQIFVMLR